MRILYSALTEYFWMHIMEVVNNMAELGHEVHVVSFLRSRPERLHPSVSFYNITLRNRGWQEFCAPAFWRQILHWGQSKLTRDSRCSFYECWIENIIDSISFDLIYERNCHFNPAIKLAYKQGIPSLLEFNGIWPLEARWKEYSIEQVQCFLKQEVSAAKQATRVICVSQGARDYYIDQGIDASKIHVIPNGANSDLFQPLNKQQSREKLGLKSDERIIGFTGSLQIFYEIDCVIKAMPLILKQVPNARLVIVGREYPPPSGTDRSTLYSIAKQLGVADRVSFIEAVPYEDVPYYINSFDICLLPLIERDNWQAALSPLKLREYLSCGRTVVASDVSGDIQILKKAETGLLYNAGDMQSLADKVCTLLKNLTLAQEMGEKGRRYVLDHGTWLHVAKKINTIAEEIITKAKKV